MVTSVGSIGRVFRRYRALINKFGAGLGRVFQHFAFARCVQQIGINRERRFAALVFRHRNLVLLGIGDEFFAALQIPFAPGRDDFNIGIAGIIAKFKAHLVIALAGSPWHTASALVSAAISTCRLAIKGRAIEVPSK